MKWLGLEQNTMDSSQNNFQQKNACKMAQNVIKPTQIFCVWNPMIPNNHESIWIDMNLLEWCWNVANGSGMHCIGFE